jgi:glycolate oxidase FAD binding subunit
LTRCPTEWKRSLPVWGLPRGDGFLMKRVKDRLDPGRVFNPGRFVDGI